MKSQKISNWLQIVANLGIVIGLLLVGVQLKQNSDLLKIQLLYDESRRLVDLEVLVVGDNGADAWAKSISDPKNMSLPEQRIMEALLWSYIEQLRSTRLLAEQGLLEDDEWRLRVNGESAFFLGNDYGRAWWENFSSGNNALPDDLKAAVNSRLSEVNNNFTEDYVGKLIDLMNENDDVRIDTK